MSKEREGSSQCWEIPETQQPQLGFISLKFIYDNIALDRLNNASFLELMSENKPLPGFENPGRSIYTCLRELVDNALDSAESVGRRPFVVISIEEVDDDKESSNRKRRAAKRKKGVAGSSFAAKKSGATEDKTYILTCTTAIEKCCRELRKKIMTRYKEKKRNDLVNVHFPECAEAMMSIIEQSKVRLARKNGGEESIKSGDLQKLCSDNKFTKDNLVVMLSKIHMQVGTAPEDASEQSHQGTAHVDFMEEGEGEGEGERRNNTRQRTDEG